MFRFGFKYRTQRVPELIPKPTVAQLLDETTTRRVYIYGIQDDNGTDVQNFSLDLTPPPDVIMKTSPGTSEGMNVLGIVIFSATMGKWLQLRMLRCIVGNEHKCMIWFSLRITAEKQHSLCNALTAVVAATTFMNMQDMKSNYMRPPTQIIDNDGTLQ